MNKIKFFLILIVSFYSSILFAQKPVLKVGSNPVTINSSAALEIESTSKGLLPPRMTSAQMNAIATPATGLHVFCSDCSPVGLQFFNGTDWTAVGDTSGGSSSSGGVSATMAFTTGTWIWGSPSVTRNIVITITNNSFSAVSWTNAAGNLVLTGGNSGVTVGTPTAAGGTSSGTTTTIPSGGTGTITFPVTGVIGNMNTITATWTKLALTVVGTKAITGGSATFTKLANTAFVLSVNASGVNIAGTLPIGTTVALPYTSGIGSYAAFTGNDQPINAADCADGASTWTIAYSYPGGTFATSGSITATLITKKNGVVTAWPAKQVTNIGTINNLVAGDFIYVNNAVCYNGVDPVYIGVDYGGDTIRGALASGGCASCVAYDAAAVNDVVKVTAAEFNALSTVVPGITNFGRKAADDTKSVGGIAFTNFMFKNTITVGAYPFAFSTLLGSGAAGVKLIKQSSTSTGGLTSIDYNAGACYSATFAAGLHYFVLKRPDVAMPANTSIAVKGPQSCCSNSNGSGIEGTPANMNNYSTSSLSENSTTCTANPAATVFSVPTSDSYNTSTWYTNYSIKWTETKSW